VRFSIWLFYTKVAIFIGLGAFLICCADRWFDLTPLHRNLLGWMLIGYGMIRVLIRVSKKAGESANHEA
jgi:hypothetical protein